MQASHQQKRVGQTEMHKQPRLEAPLHRRVEIQIIPLSDQGEQLLAGDPFWFG